MESEEQLRRELEQAHALQEKALLLIAQAAQGDAAKPTREVGYTQYSEGSSSLRCALLSAARVS
jgi:hypothetical protein